MNIANFSAQLFCKVDDAIPDAPRDSQAILSGNEVVTIGILYLVKGLTAKDPAARFLPPAPRNYGHLFPQLPERSCWFRRWHTQRHWTGRFLATPHADWHCRQLRR